MWSGFFLVGFLVLLMAWFGFPLVEWPANQLTLFGCRFVFPVEKQCLVFEGQRF